jgi:hypothetical protein
MYIKNHPNTSVSCMTERERRMKMREEWESRKWNRREE